MMRVTAPRLLLRATEEVRRRVLCARPACAWLGPRPQGLGMVDAALSWSEYASMRRTMVVHAVSMLVARIGPGGVR